MHYIYKRIFSISVLFSCIIFLCNCTSKTSTPAPNKSNGPIIVDVIIAAKQSISDVIEANGNVIANEFVEFRPEVSGRLTYLNIAEGKPIAKGTVVARVNDADLRATLARSSVQLILAEKTVERYQKLLAVNGLNQADYDAALNTMNGFKADINYTKALIDKTVIRAPFNGVAGLRQVSPGAYVTPATIIATLQQTSQVKIDFTMPETYSNVIHNGMEIAVELDASKKLRGKAIIIATEPGANTNTRNLMVRAILKSGTTNPGGFVKVFIDAGKNRESIKIPANCIIPDDRNNQVVLVKNGRALFVNIKTGVRDASNVEVIEGISVGDSVVVTGVLFARPKSEVKVRSVKQITNPSDSSAAKY